MHNRWVKILFISFIAVSCKEPAAEPAVAEFFVEGAACTAPCTVSFWNNSTNDVHWDWDFGNGVTSFKENDTVTYYQDTTYQVTLTVWNIDNVSDQITKSVTIY